MSDEALRRLQRAHEESPEDLNLVRSYLRALEQAGERGERLHDLWALLLKEHYGVTFPPDLFQAWDFFVGLAEEAGQDDPRYVLQDLTFTLSGPFQLLHQGLADLEPPEIPLLMGWRYYMDPPEFFTVAHGEGDGEHWGYWFDDPDAGTPSLVCSYYTNDAYDFSIDGDSLLEALYSHLESELEAIEEEQEDDDPEEAERLEEEAEKVRLVREKIDRWHEEFPPPPESEREPTVPTFGDMGLVVPGVTEDQLLPTESLYERASEGEDCEELIAEGRTSLAEGNVGRAIQIAQAAWTMHGCQSHHGEAAELLAACYEALGRPTLAWVARTQAKHRSLPNVDLLT